MFILHPIKSIKKALLKKLINEALDELPALKAQGLNYLKAHKDEFITEVKNHIKTAVKAFIEKKSNEAKLKLLNATQKN